MCGKNIRDYRLLKGLTQEELARQAQISVTTLGHIETGRTRKPEKDTIEKIARALEVRIEDLVGFLPDERIQNSIPSRISSTEASPPPNTYIDFRQGDDDLLSLHERSCEHVLHMLARYASEAPIDDERVVCTTKVIGELLRFATEHS